MKYDNVSGILKGIKNATAFVQRNQSRALVVRPPKPNKAVHPAPSGSS